MNDLEILDSFVKTDGYCTVIFPGCVSGNCPLHRHVLNCKGFYKPDLIKIAAKRMIEEIKAQQAKLEWLQKL